MLIMISSTSCPRVASGRGISSYNYAELGTNRCGAISIQESHRNVQVRSSQTLGSGVSGQIMLLAVITTRLVAGHGDVRGSAPSNRQSHETQF